jgi:hypothetical protein
VRGKNWFLTYTARSRGGGGEVVEVNYGERTVTISKKLLRFLTGKKTKLAEFLAGGLFKTES